jgi:hypothetical protein
MPNLIYFNPEPTIAWRSSGGDELFLSTGAPINAGSGRQGALHDFGAAARSRRYRWRAWFVPGATRTLYQAVGIFWKTSDGTVADNDDGPGDIPVSGISKLANVTSIGTIVIDEDAAVQMSSHGEIEVPEQWGGPIFWNYTTASLSSTAGDYGFDLQPVPAEIQD